MANEIDSLEVKISSQAEEAFSKLDQLVAKLDAVASSLGKISSNRAIKGLGDSVGTAGTKVNNFVPKLEKLQELFAKFNEQGTLEIKVTGINEEMLTNLVNFTDKLKDVKNTIRQIDRAGALSGTSKGIEKAAKKAQEFQDISSKSEKVAITPEIKESTVDNIDKAAKSYNKLNQEAEKAKAWKTVQNTFSKMLNPAVKIFGTGVKAALKPVSMFTKGISSLVPSMTNLSKSLARTYKMLRLMIVRSALRAMITNTEQGFKNLTQYSDQFNSSVSMLWNSLRQLGNAFAAASSPMINAFAPAIDWLIQKIISAINAINQLMSALLGNSTWIKATHLADKYGAAVGGAAGGAEKLNKQLQGFDELNNLTSNNGGGGGGGGGAGTNASDMFTTEAIDSYWKNLADKIKQTWETTADFTWLGEDIGKRLNDALINIDTNVLPGMKTFAIKLGKAIGTAITGFVEVKDLGHNIGKTIADAIDVAVSGINSFFTNVHWKSVGQFIADGINGVFDSDLLDDLVTMFVKLFNASVESFAGFASNVQWGKIGTQIGVSLNKAIKKIDTATLAQGISDFVDGALTGAIAILEQTDFKEVGKKLAAFIQNIDWKSITIDLIDLALHVVDALCDAIVQLWNDGGITAKLGLAIAGLIGAVKITGIVNKLVSVLTTVFGAATSSSALASSIPVWNISLSVAVAIGSFSIGKKLYNSIPAVQEGADALAELILGDYKLSEIMDAAKDLIDDKIHEFRIAVGIEKEGKKHESSSGAEHGGSSGTFGGIVEYGAKKAEKALDNLNNATQKFANSTRTSYKTASDTIISKMGISQKAIDDASQKSSASLLLMSENAKYYTEQMSGGVSRSTNDMANNVLAYTGTMKTTANANVNAMSVNFSDKFRSMNTNGSNSMSSLQTSTNNSFTAMDNKVSTSSSNIFKNVSTNFANANNSATNTSNVMANAVGTIYNNILNNASSKTSTMSSNVTSNFNTMGKNATTSANNTSSLIVTAFDNVSNGVANKMGGVPIAVSGGLAKAAAYITAQNWRGAGTNLVAGLSNGISSSWSGNLLATVTRLAQTLTNRLKSAFGVHSPSRVWRDDIGVWLPAGLEVGIEKGEQSLLNTVSDLGSKVNNAMANTDFLNPFSDMGDINGNVNVNYAADAQDLATNMATAMANSMNSSQQQQNDLLRQQNSLLAQILEKDTGISADDLFNSVRRSNRAYFNQTGDNALVY